MTPVEFCIWFGEFVEKKKVLNEDDLLTLKKKISEIVDPYNIPNNPFPIPFSPTVPIAPYTHLTNGCQHPLACGLPSGPYWSTVPPICSKCGYQPLYTITYGNELGINSSICPTCNHLRQNCICTGGAKL